MSNSCYKTLNRCPNVGEILIWNQPIPFTNIHTIDPGEKVKVRWVGQTAFMVEKLNGKEIGGGWSCWDNWLLYKSSMKIEMEI
jgi:hypothetical protein